MAEPSKKASRIIRRVWDNDGAKRYVPRAFSSDGPGWGVWDKREEKFIERDRDICAIDPDELFAN